MATVRLPDELVEKAKAKAEIMHRSVPKQIEYWAKLGMEQENKSLTPEQKRQLFKDTMVKFDQAFKDLAL